MQPFIILITHTNNGKVIKMILQSMIGMAAVLMSAFLSYAFHFFMVRSLPPSLYGDLSLVIGFLTIILVPTGSMQTVLAREVAKLGSQEGRILQFLRGYAKNAAAYGIILAVLMFFLSFAIGFVFNDQNLVLPLQLVSLSIPMAFLLSLANGYLQGREEIGKLSILMVINPAIKLAAGFLLVYAGFGLLGASASFAIAPLAVLALIGAIFLKRKNKIHKGIRHKLDFHKPFLFILAANIILMVFLYLDLFFVKYYLGSEDAGFYNVADITAKVMMFAVGGITMVFLPKSSKLSMGKDKVQIKKLLMKAVLLMLPIFAAFMVFPEQIISIFYTGKYLSALVPFRILTIGMFAYALFTILLNLSWSQNREKAPLIFSSIALAADALLLFYLIPVYGLTGAALSTTISSLALLAVLALYLKRSFGKKVALNYETL